MTWIWQQSAWPRFTWDAVQLAPLEARFLHESGQRIGVWRHLADGDRTAVRVDWLRDEALDTSAIEGEILDRASVQSSIRRHFGLAAEARSTSRAAEGVSEMMVALFRDFDQPLEHETLWSWQRMLLGGRRDLEVIGGYRRHSDPMQIVSGPDYRRKVHFEAPPSSRMAAEMDRFIAWYNGARSALLAQSPLTRAGIAHLHFVCIHPFEDGNGRIARALSEKALAQSLGEPSLIALSRRIAGRRKAYYDTLEAAGRSLDVTDWLVWFAGTVLDAQSWSTRRLIRSLEQTRLFDRLHNQLNPRQENVLLRLFEAEPDGFKGGLSAANYVRVTGAPPSTATRDLADLVSKGALRRTGERRHTRYWLNLPPFAEAGGNATGSLRIPGSDV